MDPTAIGVIGLGTMGIGIVQVFASAGYQVLATDSQAPACASANHRLAAALASRVQAGKLTETDSIAILSRVRVVDGPARMAPVALAIEAVVEDLPVKRAIFSALERVIAPDSILASNTSSLPIAQMAEGLACPGRLVGLHFFNPAPAMKLVELVAHADTAPWVLPQVRALMKPVGKTLIDCPDRPGFIVNRCARPFYGEALALLEEGRSAAAMDAAMLAAGYRLGPFSLIDLVGADINLAATEGLNRAMGGHPRYHVFAALRAQAASGNLGRKTGKGFVFPDQPGSPPGDADAIVLRIEATLANEAAWLLAEGGTTREGIDTAMKLGLNLPRGPFECLEAQGTDRIIAELARLEGAAPAHLRGRYLPAPELVPA
ncbi:3-hydroxyacyl-CoA dehydrogenase [Rhodobacter calidifons]|uniref:3-hydroxybutyryl-CoA dehydrogenase n=1 Tax=Rhodobacter calidifons TaxID=2715277 RepID=A0ABX0G384_9RHOB|nr:3-hydroxyacyl-CoA dehydrogenase NAD-binding domain-containing protein [Rhodobacter calidifons]NHB75620.1 3-hydroxybutyryl-CoA dehydrogenase [Rhodobacter calidifons]